MKELDLLREIDSLRHQVEDLKKQLATSVSNHKYWKRRAQIYESLAGQSVTSERLGHEQA